MLATMEHATQWRAGRDAEHADGDDAYGGEIVQLDEAVDRAAARGVSPDVLTEARALHNLAVEGFCIPVASAVRKARKLADQAMRLLGDPPSDIYSIKNEGLAERMARKQAAPSAQSHPANADMRRRIEQAKAEGEAGYMRDLRRRINTMRAATDALGEVARSKDIDFRGALHPNGRDRQAEDPRLWRACAHEAAHITFALVNRLPLVAAIAERNGSGRTTIGAWRAQDVSKRAAMLYSGWWGEHVVGGGSSTFGDADDMRRVRAMMGELDPDRSWGDDYDECPAVKHAIRNAAETVEVFDHSIHALARLLFDNAGKLIGRLDLEFVHGWLNDDPKLAELKADAEWRSKMRAKGWPVPARG